jgi:hypothetical protein
MLDEFLVILLFTLFVLEYAHRRISDPQFIQKTPIVANFEVKSFSLPLKMVLQNIFIAVSLCGVDFGYFFLSDSVFH